MHHRTPIETDNPVLTSFFQLFHNSNHSPIFCEISTDCWTQHWKSAREKTASSYSSIHYGHCKVQSQSYLLSNVKCKLINLAIRNGSPLYCWTKDILVMLEKKPRIIKVTKLRAILLLEANFNGINKILFNTRLIPLMEQAHIIPKEIIGSRRA